MNRKLGDLNKVWEIKALKTKPRAEEAKKILERISKEVQPIMRNHKWRVKVLSEFCPKRQNLLGLNVGAGVNVKLRLRRPNNDFEFYPHHEVLDTMLHELCHNAHGSHDAKFYKLWDELRVEYEELVAKGITGSGQGFDLPGRRLGGFSLQPPLSALRKNALAAAGKRAQLGSLLPTGPQRLGGDSSIMVALSPSQAAAMAAERRFQDEIWCGSHSSEVYEDGENNSYISEDLVCVGENTGSSKTSSASGQHQLDANAVSRKRHHDSDKHSFSQSSNGEMESTFVDLTTDSSASTFILDRDIRTQKRSKSYSTMSSSSNCHPGSSFVDLSSALISGSMLNHAATYIPEQSTMWECAMCTLLNPSLALMCELCHTLKPKDNDAKYKMWSCKFCTLENSAKLDKCSACDQWRYSYGQPVSTQTFNLGT
ncbi:zf-RanBP domain-containing protein/WLM domain-containing protein [Cephalotus follicularis]|uniref:Zf-RanBP domain-containing protein/WLM domain-containing protein n=1 Tax=Cephalotus follicularis TaxID=3775 RepID=A0A1Q3BLA5_CEPFO|nr:zf-RanBP domain-containing protein/WLM domain-containing protein [Cephalotus follicularis]